MVLKKGQTYHVTAFGSDCSVAQQQLFLSLGIVPDSALEVLEQAPLGDPFEVYVNGRFLSIPRKLLETLEFRGSLS